MLCAEVNWDTCRACDPCSARLVCKTKAIVKIDADEPTSIEPARCNGCGNCLLACPYGAIALSNIHVPNARSARIGSA